jgi:RNA polymerase sigma-70 factor (ECF subfamily)
MSQSVITEEEWIARAQAGCSEAFRVLVERHRQAIYGLAYHLLGDAEAAEDVAQEVFIEAYLSLTRLRDRSKFSAWLTGIAVHKATDWQRRHLRWHLWLDRSSPESLPEPADPDPSASPEQAYEAREFRAAVARAVRALPPKYRAVAALRFFEERTVTEMMDLLGLSRAAVESQLRRARAMVQERLHREYPELEGKG